MPGSHRLPLRRMVATAAVLQTAVVLFASRAMAAPTPTPTPTPAPSASNDPCALIAGPAREYCDRGSGQAPSTGLAPNNPADALNP